MTRFVYIFLLTTGAIRVVINKVAILSVNRRNTIVHFYWIFGKLLKTVHYHRTLIPYDKKIDDNNRSGKFIKSSMSLQPNDTHLYWKLLFHVINIYSTNTITAISNKKFTFFSSMSIVNPQKYIICTNNVQRGVKQLKPFLYYMCHV